LIAIPAVLYAGRSVGVDFRSLLQAIGRQMVGAIAVCVVGGSAICFLPEGIDRLSRIAIGGSVCVATYLVLVMLVLRLRHPIGVALSVFKQFRSRR